MRVQREFTSVDVASNQRGRVDLLKREVYDFEAKVYKVADAHVVFCIYVVLNVAISDFAGNLVDSAAFKARTRSFNRNRFNNNG